MIPTRPQDAPMGAQPQTYTKNIPLPFIRAALISLLLFGVVAAGLFLISDPGQRSKFMDILSPMIDLLSAVLLLVGAKASVARSKGMTIAWTVLALAGLLYAIGDGVWAYLEVLRNDAPFPSLADAFYLAYYPAFLLGVILLLKRPETVGEIVNNALDLAIILAAAVLGFDNFLIGPIINSNADATAFERAILAAYPVGDLVMLGALLLILYNDPHASSDRKGLRDDAGVQQSPIPVFLLAAGMLIMIVSDCAYSYQSLLGTYASGGALDLGWIAAGLIIGMAGVAQWTALQPQPNAIGDYLPDQTFREWAKRIKTFLPYAWLLGAFSLLVASALTPLPMPFLSIALGVGVILALVLVRQFIALSTNAKLNLQLKDQTAKLENVNRDLNLEIAERLRAQEKLAFDVLHDQMTGLANRRLFLDRLGQAIKRSRRHKEMSFAVLFLDLDAFKVVNDSLGHTFGDQLLISVGKRLEAVLRSGDTVARFGGDEFAILLDDLDNEASAIKTANKVRDAIGEPFHLNDHDVHITASIGIATDLTKYEYADELLRDVDLAMYRAKSLGKARCALFRVEMRDQVFSRLVLEEGLRNALKNGEFQLYYQPITSLESDRIVGLEALLRWVHPTRGVLLPIEFLPVAEESDMILPIGEWVLNEACRQLREWHDRYPSLAQVTVNVNMSNREFAQANLPDKVCRALQANNLKGSLLKLEITERVLVDNYPTANDVIGALNEMGVQVEIDDFGTGYSALAYLQQLPIDAIKIDKSFISEMRNNRKGLGLVRAIVSMARELGMETIAEGIETGEQLSELKGLLCGYGQGFLLSVPLDAVSAGRILEKQAVDT
jgi:diguanylate cyclase (GGDEF)-like protein